MDRDLQREILNRLAELYPVSIDPTPLIRDVPEMVQELAYLEEHKLVELAWSKPMSARPTPISAKITAKGLDFLSDDGGLSAILGVVTIKLHDDTIRQLMIQKIEGATEISPQERSSLIEAVRNLPAKSIEKLTDSLLEHGAEMLVSKSPQLYTSLAHFLGSLAS